VDATPSAPAREPRAAMVAASLPHGSTVLPQTATPATLQLFAGTLALLLAAMGFGFARRARRLA
jgi:LPXTG-motif cell wall-anchored protein